MDAVLEAAIDEAGRPAVFAVMRANGWGPYDRPPQWCWWEAVRIAKTTGAIMDEGLGGQ